MLFSFFYLFYNDWFSLPNPLKIIRNWKKKIRRREERERREKRERREESEEERSTTEILFDGTAISILVERAVNIWTRSNFCFSLFFFCLFVFLLGEQKSWKEREKKHSSKEKKVHIQEKKKKQKIKKKKSQILYKKRILITKQWQAPKTYAILLLWESTTNPSWQVLYLSLEIPIKRGLFSFSFHYSSFSSKRINEPNKPNGKSFECKRKISENFYLFLFCIKWKQNTFVCVCEFEDILHLSKR